MALVIGLTGGIGSGKSAVAGAFCALGVEVTDTDRLAHALTAAGQPALSAIVDMFGASLLRPEGGLDRAALRKRVFADPAARARLEALLHPLIRAAAAREVAAWQGPYGILVVPLLFEGGGLSGVVHRVLVVDCPEDLQVQRAMTRSGLAEPEVRAIMAAQLSRSARLARADDVIDNAGAPDTISPAVARMDRRYRAMAAASSPGSL